MSQKFPTTIRDKLNFCVTITTHLEETCPFCGDIFFDLPAVGWKPVKLICKHIYHENCINAWIKTHSTCLECVSNILHTEQGEEKNNIKFDEVRKNYT